jgi:hypothetical protein
MNCDQCTRREHRIKLAKRDLDLANKNYMENPTPANDFAVEAAQRYMSEALSSHPDHPLKR